MKKTVLSIIAFLSMFLFANSVLADDQVKVYMLTKEGCSGCEVAYEYFDELESKEPDLFELVPFEVFNSTWKFNSDELNTLFTKVYEYFKEDTSSASTPTIVIGDYHVLGLPQDRELVYNAIKEAKENGKDVVAEIAKKENLNLEELKYDRNAKKEEVSGKYDTLIIVGIFIIIIGGFAGFVILGKK